MRPSSAYADMFPRALAISLGLGSAEPHYACRVRGAQIAAIVRRCPLAVAANCLIGVILLVTLQGAGLMNRSLLLWAVLLFAVSLNELCNLRVSSNRKQAGRPASPRAIWRAVLHAGMFGAFWGTLPLIACAGASPSVQVLIGAVTAGMICAGGFMLATVPLAGIIYIAMILAGATAAVLSQTLHPADLGILALLWVYAGVVVVCLCSNAHLFVEHFLASARLEAAMQARDQAQAEVARCQRMSALGQLAGGVAHDFNNILQSVTGNATLLARRAGDVEQTRLLARSILDAADRGGAISGRLLAFTRQDKLSARPLAVGTILNDAAALLEHTLHRSISLGVYASPDLPCVLADKAQLETVLVNLAVNARDAMPRGGTLSFQAVAEVIEPYDIGPKLRPGPYVRLAVTDNGAGMDAATLARAAEPFFTTKPDGKGTGLGLAMAKTFAEKSGGAFAIASEPGLGTVVTLWLPQTTEKAVTPRPGLEPPPFAPDARRLLIVDDDMHVRESLVRMLEDAGFDAVGVVNAAVARDLVERGLDIDLIITDFSMPGINGIELLEEVQALRPELPAILLTGLAGEVPSGSAARFVLVQKPVRPNVLLQHVWDSLMVQMAF